MRPERVERFENIGFVWKSDRYIFQWEERFAQLADYKKKYGHCNVPARWKKDPTLGGWVHNQRAFKRQGTLSPERIRKLRKPLRNS